MKISKKMVVFILILGLSICEFKNVHINAWQKPESYLKAIGVEEEVINQMTDSQIAYIVERLTDLSDVSFVGYNQYVCGIDGKMSKRVGTIGDDELSISIFVSRGSINGDPRYLIFPTFEWKDFKRVSNDSFAVNLFPGWAVVSGEVNLELYIKNMNGDKVQSVSINPWSTAETGYNFVIPSSIGFLNELYEGHAYFQARRINPSALNQIIIQYVHDASSSCDISYGVSIGPGFIGLNGNSSELYSWTDSLDFIPVGE